MTTPRPVPYVSAWSAEQLPPPDLIQLPDNRGIAYADETLGDRDKHGILWKRAALSHGTGTPLYGTVHPARQRRAMRKLLCQVCANPADTNHQGTLWVLRDFRHDWPDWPNGMGVTEPPICEPCLHVATRHCPALRKGHAIIRVRTAPLAGIHGALYLPAHGPAPQPVGPVLVPITDPNTPWILASHLARALHGATIIDR